MYTLTNETPTRRTYRSTITGTEIATKVIYTDGAGNNWWAFEDLLQIPFIRKKASEKVSQLFGVGITHEDLAAFVAKQKTTLKGSDPERYEKAYAELLNLEQIISETSDAVKQSLSMCSIYILSQDERVDTFSFQEAVKKMDQWAIDLDAQAFFLEWWTAGINDFTTHYSSITQIASQLKETSLANPKEPTTN